MSATTWRTAAPLGELMAGETARWDVGICRLEAQIVEPSCYSRPIAGAMAERPTHIAVYGDGDRLLNRVPLDRSSPDEVDFVMAYEIDDEHGAL